MGPRLGAICYQIERTEIHMLQEGHIQRSSNCVGLIFVENNLAAVITFVQRLQDIFRIVDSLAVVGDMASACTSLTNWQRAKGVVRLASVGSRIFLSWCGFSLGCHAKREEKTQSLG